MLGPCTALYRLFLKHCTLTNKAVGTIWRALSKPPQRRQGPDLRPLWLLVGTPSAIRSELAFSRAEHCLSPYSDVTVYIFAILYLSSMLNGYRFKWPLRLGWLLVCRLYKEAYLPNFKLVSFWLHGCCGEWEGWARLGQYKRSLYWTLMWYLCKLWTVNVLDTYVLLMVTIEVYYTEHWCATGGHYTLTLYLTWCATDGYYRWSLYWTLMWY